MVDIYCNIPEVKKEIFNQFLYTKNKNFRDRLLELIGIKRMISRPVMIVIETINKCNNNCIICGNQYCTRKKQIMSIDLFEKLLQDYVKMGGGYISLTPQVGEIFLDPFLQQRLEKIKNYPEILGISVTTNAVLADKFDGQNFKNIINSFMRIHISIYGLDESEYSMMTRRNTYHRMVNSVRKIIEASETCNIAFGFRFIKTHTQQEIENWMIQNFGKIIHYGWTNEYMNWGGGIKTDLIELPSSAQWKSKCDRLKSACIFPFFVYRIFPDGNVSFCGCVDFNNAEEFALGDINKQTLLEIFNSEKNQKLWDFPHFIPVTCQNCTHYAPISDYENLIDLFKSPLFAIGG